MKGARMKTSAGMKGMGKLVSMSAMAFAGAAVAAADPAFPDLATTVTTVRTPDGEAELAVYAPRLKVKAPALLLIAEEKAADFADGTSGPSRCQWPVSVITAKGYAALALDCAKLQGDFHEVRVAAVKAAIDALAADPASPVDVSRIAVIGESQRAETAARAAAADGRIAYALANNPVRKAGVKHPARDVWTDETAFDFAACGAKTVIGYEMSGKSERDFQSMPAKFWRFGGPQLTGYDWLAYMDYLDAQGWKIDLATVRLPREFKVLAWNIEGQSQSPKEVASMIELIRDMNPDVVLIVENYGLLPKLATGLGAGWHAVRYSMSLALVTRWPVVRKANPFYAEWNYLDGSGPFNLGLAELDVAGQRVRTCPLWINWEPSQTVPEGATAEGMLRIELAPPRFSNRRIDEINGILASLQREIAEADEMPLVIGGDFNGHSHLDWTEASKDLRNHAGLVVPWPTSLAMEKAGFTDSFRAVNPDPVANYGVTYPSRGGKRIDFIYAKGAKLRPVASESLLAAWHKPFQWRGKDYASFPSDHGFVLTTFELDTPPPEQYDNLPRGQ